MSVVSHVERMLREYTRAWSFHDAENVASFFSNNGVYEDVAIGFVKHGKKDITDFLQTTFVSFPDFKAEIKSLFVADN